VAAPEGVAKAIDSLQSHSTSHPTSFAQKGALAAYKGPQDCVGQMLAEYATRRKIVADSLSKMPGIKFVMPQGAFYFLVDISGTGLNSTQFSERLLDKQKVAVVPGIAFGDDKTIRLSYATSVESIEKGMTRMMDFVKGISVS
jgi:aspartate aminotransferase